MSAAIAAGRQQLSDEQCVDDLGAAAPDLVRPAILRMADEALTGGAVGLLEAAGRQRNQGGYGSPARRPQAGSSVCLGPVCWST